MDQSKRLSSVTHPGGRANVIPIVCTITAGVSAAHTICQRTSAECNSVMLTAGRVLYEMFIKRCMSPLAGLRKYEHDPYTDFDVPNKIHT